MSLQKVMTERQQLQVPDWHRFRGESYMGDQRTADVASYLKTECSGFVGATARAFIQRHADPKVLLGQLKSLYLKGEHSTCADLIQLICEELHPLSSESELFVLRAKIAFEEEAGYRAAAQWLKQAKMNLTSSSTQQVQQSVADFELLLNAQEQLGDGLYQDGENTLEQLVESFAVGGFAKYLLGRHQLLKSQKIKSAILNLESALQMKETFKKGWEALGFAYNKNGQKAAAQEAFAKCIELETNPQKLDFYKQQLAS